MSDIEALLRWVGCVIALRIFLAKPISKFFAQHAREYVLPLFLLLWTYIYWLWGSLGTLPSLNVAVWISLLIASFVVFGLSRSFPPLEDPGHRSTLVGELVFWGIFLGATIIRMFSPWMNVAERYADMSVYQSLLLDHQFPPMDVWLPPLKVNYYYFGHLLFVPITRLTGVPSEIAFNLSVVTIAAMAASVLYATAYQVTRSLWAGVLSGLSLMLFSNWEWIRQVLKAHSVAPFSWWDSSRAMPFTITEFPYFSFLLGDFHPHYIALPWLGIAAALAIRFRNIIGVDLKKRVWILGGLLALSVGVHYPLNPWELPFIAGIVALFNWRQIYPTACVGVASFFLFLPYWLAYEPPLSKGHWVPKEMTSSFPLFLGHWGLFLVPIFYFACRFVFKFSARVNAMIVLIAGVVVMFGGSVAGVMTACGLVLLWKCFIEKKWHVESILVLMGIAATIFCEFVHLDDLYGPQYRRMNTVFKFYMMAWWVWALAIPVLVWRHRALFSKFRRAYIAAAFLMVLFSLFYPVYGTKGRIYLKRDQLTLDGMGHWKRAFPGEREALSWIRSNTKPRDMIWEATGVSYKHFARFSSFSGRPTILGWATHEWVWFPGRKKYTEERHRDLTKVDKHPTDKHIRDFIKKYQVQWIVLGKLERENYSKDLVKALEAFPVVFERSGTKILKASHK